MNLRELTNDQKSIKTLVENEELTQEQVEDHLDMLADSIKEKIENYLFVIRDIESRLESKNKEIERIKALADADEKAISRMKDWLLGCMEDGEKHEFDLFKVTKVKGRQVVQINDSDKIPASFLAHKPESWSPDKKLILEKLKAGEVISGTELSTGKPSLRIK